MRDRLPLVATTLATTLAIGLGSMLGAGCQGALLDRAAGPTGAPRMGPPTVCDDGLAIGSAPMRRLSRTEYLATMEDLFPGVSPDLPDIPDDTRVIGFENDARTLGATDVQVARWEEIAFRYTRDVTASPAALGGILPCAASAVDDASERACGEQMVRDFGLRAFRRPLSADEEARYRTFFEAQRGAIDFEAAVQLTAMAMLQSPQFLYRLEIPDPARASGATVALTSYEVASRLSFFLWGRMPDEELFAAAARDELTSREAIETQARRMLEHPNARRAVADFHRQWLDFDRILDDEHVTRVPELYPAWTPELRAASRTELDRFVEHTVFEGDGTLSALLLSRETEVDASLASVYGVSAPGSGWAPATLPEGQRAGLLTRVGFLAAHAHSGNGSPPLRGVFIMERLLCEPRPSPPPDANVTPPAVEPGAPPATNRQLFEERTAPDRCQACHVRIDGFGYGLEHYDAIGAYRELDNGLPVDASSTLVGTDVDGDYVGGIELSEQLASSRRVADCAVQRWYRFASGRGVEAEDQCAVDRLEARFAATGGDVIELMVDVVTSPEFRNRPLEQE